MGRPMVQNLLKGGHTVNVWNRTTAKAQDLKTAATPGTVNVCATPAEVVRQSTVTFSMLADPLAIEQVYFSKEGAMKAIAKGKSVVDMSTIDVGTVLRLAEGIKAAGGRYLEAPISGSKKPAEEGRLVVMAAGDAMLYDELQPVFALLAKHTFFLGECGQAAKTKLVANMLLGDVMAALSETFMLADRAGVSTDHLMQVLSLTSVGSPLINSKGPLLKQRSYPPAFLLRHQQKDLRLALEMATDLALALPVSAIVKERYDLAERLGQGNQDFSAVHEILAKAIASVRASA